MNIHDACEEAYKRGYERGCERGKTAAEEEIKRKNAEIERLQGWQDLLKAEKHSLIKAEAIKEFVAELLEKYCFHNSEGEGIVFDTDIYNLAKEMGVEL